jgi:hypothetical protein
MMGLSLRMACSSKHMDTPQHSTSLLSTAHYIKHQQYKVMHALNAK